MRSELKYVFDNILDQKQCNECGGVWLLFDHEGRIAYYRLSPVAPCDCSVCEAIDIEIEKDCIITREQWLTLK